MKIINDYGLNVVIGVIIYWFRQRWKNVNSFKVKNQSYFCMEHQMICRSSILKILMVNPLYIKHSIGILIEIS